MEVSTQLVRYDAMVNAIVACHSVDELKDMHDKALALELYAKQAKNTDAERKAADVRLRAERRTGELLKDLARAQGARTDITSSNGVTKLRQPSAYSAALQSTGMSRQTASRYQALAEVPRETFESHLADPVRKPTTTRLINEARAPAPKIDDRALWIWGRVRDFERDGYIDADPEILLADMTETMRADIARLVPSMIEHAEVRRLQEPALQINPHLEQPPAIDPAERYLVALFLRRYVTYCARRKCVKQMHAAAGLYREVTASASP
jgi:hypothetical protein